MKNLFRCGILATSLLFIFSCGNDNLDLTYKEIKSIDPRTCVGFSSAELDSIGTLHNEYLSDIMPYYNPYMTNWQLELANSVDEAGTDNGFSSAVKDSAIARMNNAFDISNYSSEFDNYSDVSTYYGDIVSLIDNLSEWTSSSNYSNFVGDLDDIRRAANADLTCFDMAFIEASLSVADHSGYYWMPTTEGGAGHVLPGPGTGISKWWKAVIGGDLSGLATGFMAYGVGLAVPGTNAAIAVTLAFEAGASSAFAAAAASR